MTGEGAVPRQEDYVSPIGNVVSLHPALRVRFIHLALPLDVHYNTDSRLTITEIEQGQPRHERAFCGD